MAPAQTVSLREVRRTKHSVHDLSNSSLLGPETVSAEYSIQVATTADAIEALRPVWKKWAYSLDTDIDYFLCNLTHDSTIMCPYVITLHKNGIPAAMLVGQVRKRRASAIVSFVNVPGPNVRVLEIKKGGRMGEPSPVVDRLLALELLKATKAGAVDSLCFERLPLNSELFRQIRQLPGFLVRKRVPNVFCYSMLSLTAHGSERPSVFYGKTQREVRRKTRILERAFPGQVQMRCFSDPGELDAGIYDAMRVRVTTWQHYLGFGLTDTAQTRENFRFFAKQGWLRIYVLYVKEVPCAFLIGQLYNNTFNCQHAGYNPSFGPFSVGALLTARAFEELASAGVERVDLGEGGQEHNRRLGCQMSGEGTVHVYSSTWRGLWLNVFFGATQAVRAGGRKTRSGLGLNWVAKTWGRFLLSRWKSRNHLPQPPEHVSHFL